MLERHRNLACGGERLVLGKPAQTRDAFRKVLARHELQRAEMHLTTGIEAELGTGNDVVVVERPNDLRLASESLDELVRRE